MDKEISIILAVDDKNWLGKNWGLAWNLSSDMKYFKRITTRTKDKNKQNALIMWRKTWESIPKKFRPLPWRINCILSRKAKKNLNKDILWFNSLNNCIKKLRNNKNIENIFIIGWANLYNNSLKDSNLNKIYITKVKWDFNCDVFFNWIPDNFKLIKKSKKIEENSIKFNFLVYKKI